jgi:adenosylcobinamide-phosphate synthase
VRPATITAAPLGGAALLAGYAADMVLGDPRRWHPVAGFGRLALALERALYRPTRVHGAVFAAVLVAVPAIAAERLARATSRSLLLAALTWAALGGRSLTREALGVADLVERERLDEARGALRALCGRDATALDGRQLCRAALESVAENTGDAVVGALLWGAVAGPAGVVAYRAANTLDAMVGHRNERYARFGWAAAKLDDAMSWPAARVAAALACVGAPLVGGSPLTAAAVMRRDGGDHPSPNSGRVEAAFAGALGITLGGQLAYNGSVEDRPRLGDGRAPAVEDVRRAARLSLAVGAAAAALCALAATCLTRARFSHTTEAV